MKKVGVIDYGTGNLCSVVKAFEFIGASVSLIRTPNDSSNIDALVFPGQGTFDQCMGSLAKTGLDELIKNWIESEKPYFGICLGLQILGIAAGMKSIKMLHGHHGANHPVKNLETGEVLITSQNHGFCLDDSQVPDSVKITHRSLFDNSVQGVRLESSPAFGFQGHPEASPGPHDAKTLFDDFVALMESKHA